MRGQGRVFRPKVRGQETEVWWLDYSVRGERHRESSATTSKRDALALLRDRIGKRSDGTLTGRPEKVSLADLKAQLQRRYLLDGNRSWKRAEQAFAHLEGFFGASARALELTRARVSAYQEARLKAGAARNTVRYETGVLNAAFTVAAENDLLPSKPILPQLAEGDKRSGFFESADFAALIVALPADLASVVRFARMTAPSQWTKCSDQDVRRESPEEPPPSSPQLAFAPELVSGSQPGRRVHASPVHSCRLREDDRHRRVSSVAKAAPFPRCDPRWRGRRPRRCTE